MKRLLAVLLFLPLLAWGQNFPSKPVKITTPYSSGSGPDLYTRALAEQLSKAWGHQVVVEPKAGGNGFIAVEQVKKAAPDGYELLVLANSHLTINPVLQPNSPYDPLTDLTPLAGLYRTPFFVTVASNGPYQTVKDLIAGAKANPGKIIYGSPYVGSPAHLGSAIFEHDTGTQMTHVPFKDTLQIYTSTANGDVTWSFATAASASAMLKANKVKLIAVAAPQRVATHPDIPTLGEAGGPKNLVVEAWLTLLGPKGMNPELVKKINADLQAVLSTPEMKKRTENLGFEVYQATPQQITDKMRQELKINAEVVKRVGAKAD